MEDIRNKKGFICDMDGVVYHGNRLLPGAREFVNWLHENNKSYLFLTNSSERSPRELRQKLLRMGLDVGEDHFYTSALATASFIASQMPGCSAYVIGAAGLINALYDQGITMNDVNPDYVVVGETSNYNYETIIRAVQLVNGGARLIGTNPDLTGPSENGIVPACRAFVSPIELATGKSAYFVGKPNPVIMRRARQLLGIDSRDLCIIGDRMDTDIIAGIESGIETVLVLSGVSQADTAEQFSYRPNHIINGLGDIVT
ncbi:MAG: HAD-IIA family hydrolase [Eubacteriales bacterium]